METLEDRVALVQAELTRLTQDLHALPADAWRQPSACTQWQIQDVVAHLTGAAEFYIDTLSRGLQGDPAPSAGFPAAGTVNAAAMAEPIAQMALATREQPAPRCSPPSRPPSRGCTPCSPRSAPTTGSAPAIIPGG